MGVKEAGRQSRMASLGPDLRLQFVYHLHNNAQEQLFTVPFQNSLVSPSQEHSWGRGGREEVLAKGIQSGRASFLKALDLRDRWGFPCLLDPLSFPCNLPMVVTGGLRPGLYLYLLFCLGVCVLACFPVNKYLLRTWRLWSPLKVQRWEFSYVLTALATLYFGSFARMIHPCEPESSYFYDRDTNTFKT